jgi:hypothetical protein
MFKYTLCGRNGSCCPVITENENDISISDDFGGQIKLTKEEFIMLKEAVTQYQVENQCDTNACGLS